MEKSQKYTLNWLVFRFAASIFWAYVIVAVANKYLSMNLDLFWTYLAVFVVVPLTFWVVNTVNTYVGHVFLFGSQYQQLVCSRLETFRFPVADAPYRGWRWEDYADAVVNWPNSTKEQCMVVASIITELQYDKNISKLLCYLNGQQLTLAVNRYVRENRNDVDDDFESFVSERI